MAIRIRPLISLSAVILAILVATGGCGTKAGKVEVTPAADGASTPAATANDAGPVLNTPNPAVTLNPKQHQPFEDAAITDIRDDSGMLPPPDRTLAGLSTGKIHDQVVQLWPQIRFVNAAGKPISYVADVEIENYGTIELLMRPDLAPNHVRNFVALATLQYYDGLRIDRLIRQQSDEDPNNKLTLLEAGSPTESAEPEIAHLGYWLKPEFTDAAKHEPGSVGACLHMSADMMSLNPESAACRFYITLTPAPAMDGNYAVFAKVSRGLELLQQLATKPTRTDPGPDFGKPTNPIVIRKITVRVVDVVE